MNPISFLREVRAELKKVTWPGREYTIQATILVVVISVAIGLYVGGLDFIFTSVINTLLKR